MSAKNYSDWMRVDLHIHTSQSRKTKTNDYKGIFSVDTLKEKLKENKVQIFSMTDHNVINLEAYEEYYTSYDPEKDPLLLLGVELDIIVGDANTDAYHSLLIFKKSNAENAKKLHDALEAFYESHGIEDLERKITMEQMVNLLPEDEEFFFIPHAGNTRSILDSYKDQIDNAQKMVLLMHSAFEKVPAQRIETYNRGFDQKLIKAFRNKDLYAYIEFSDNHNAANYPCTGHNGPDHEFYYLKGKKSYETLRLALIDPQSRIKSELQYRALAYQENYIESVKISGDTELEDVEITFSPHFNVFIGGRSSGKTLLLTLLGNKIDSVNTGMNKYKQVDFKNAKIKSKRDSQYQSETSISKDEITYITQNQIVNFFEKRDLEELAKSSGVHDAYKYQEQLFANHRLKLDAKVNQMLSEYGELDGNELNRRFIVHGETIEKLLSTKFTFEFDSDLLTKEHDNSESINESDDRLINVEGAVTEFRDDEFLDWKEDEIVIIESFEQLIEQKKEVLKKKRLIYERKKNLIEGINLIVKEQNRQLDLAGQEKAQSNEVLNKFKRDVGERFTKLKNLKNSSTILSDFDFSLRRDLEVAENVKLVREARKEESLDALIIGEVIKDSNANQSLYLNLLGLLNESMSILRFNDTLASTLRQKINTIFKPIYSSLSSPEDYLEYEDESSSKSNSPGYNSEKYLEIILNGAKSKFVFIDQPEDNLGNKFIGKTLVNVIRKIKFEKQVFVVTHNPSVVVYGDAENVIIADNGGEKINYSQHVIEDPEAQAEICQILDGGQFIFDQRAQKYNIQKLLKEENDEQGN